MTPHIAAIQHVFANLPRWHFWSANDFSYFRANKNLPNVALLKIEEPLDATKITLGEEPVRLPLCKIHYLYSLGVLFGYALEIPRFNVSVNKKYVGIVRQSAGKLRFFSDVELILQTDHMNVFHSEEGASLVAFNERYESIDPDYLRVGVKARFTERE